MIREAKTNKHRLKSWHTKKPAPTNSAENILSIPNFKLWQQTGSTEHCCPRENSWFDLKISGCQKQTWKTWNPKQRELTTSASTSDRRSLIFPLLFPSPSLIAPFRALPSPPCQSPLSRRLCTAQFSKTPHFTPHPEYSQLTTPIFQTPPPCAPELIQLDPVRSSTSRIFL